MLSASSRFSGLPLGGSGFDAAMIIRALKPEDRAAWQALWDGYLAFYDVNLSDAITESTWSRVVGGQGRFLRLLRKTAMVPSWALLIV